ncbi:MAG TPA: hypothetical protein VKA70_02285 [Blastocatellia bacterium]|nr:hypothetical protein [Blastocatellia bacterium]
MKIFVVHDKQGNIKSFGVTNKNLEGLELQPPPGASVAEVEAPDIPGMDEFDEEKFGRVLDLIDRSRVDVTGDKASLVPK